MARIDVSAPVLDGLARLVKPLAGGPRDHDDLLDLVGDARIVMLGEASHGTHEFYAVRADITRRLIEERGFSFVAIEGDWPDTYRVDRWVKAIGGVDETARDALGGFARFPTWMWRNAPTEAFVSWLRAHNDARPAGRPRVGFYGLDVYSLHASMDAVLAYLGRVDPQAREAAEVYYACLSPFRDDTQAYAQEVHYTDASCEDEMVAVLMDLWSRRQTYGRRGGEEAWLDAELNAFAALDAERYYRKMVQGGAVTWNLRDRHMMHVLERLLDRHGADAKAIIWAHNTHIGDFRATDENGAGMLNIGQLVRERYGAGSVAVGFGTHRGTVTAARRWDAPGEFMRVPPAMPGASEATFEALGHPAFALPLARTRAGDPAGAWLRETRGERAIGVVYDPARERAGNYVPSRLAERYDHYYFFAETTAVVPLDAGPGKPGLEAWPTGF